MSVIAVMICSTAAADEVRMVSSIPYSKHAEIADNNSRERVEIREQLAQFSLEYAAENGITIMLVDELSCSDPDGPCCWKSTLKPALRQARRRIFSTCV